MDHECVNKISWQQHLRRYFSLDQSDRPSHSLPKEAKEDGQSTWKWYNNSHGTEGFGQNGQHMFKSILHFRQFYTIQNVQESHKCLLIKPSVIFEMTWSVTLGRPSTVLSTHQWTQENTDRRTCPLCPHRWLRSCTAVKHTHSHQSGSEHPGTPAHRSTSSRPRGFCIAPCFGTGLGSTGPLWRAACRGMHLWTEYTSK